MCPTLQSLPRGSPARQNRGQIQARNSVQSSKKTITIIPGRVTKFCMCMQNIRRDTCTRKFLEAFCVHMQIFKNLHAHAPGFVVTSFANIVCMHVQHTSKNACVRMTNHERKKQRHLIFFGLTCWRQSLLVKIVDQQMGSWEGLRALTKRRLPIRGAWVGEQDWSSVPTPNRRDC